MRLVGSAAAAGVVIELKESGSTEFGRKELAAGSTTAADVSAKVSGARELSRAARRRDGDLAAARTGRA